MGVTPQHVRRIWREYRKTGVPHVPGRPGRPRVDITQEQEDAVIGAHRQERAGVVRTARRLHEAGRHDISRRRVYGIMKKNGLVTASHAKSKKRKWVRFEVTYSNAMWHVDWHAMKDQRFTGTNLVTYLDDASRCITGAAVFPEATSGNAVAVLRKAIEQFGAPATILSDNGSCFVGRGGRRRKDAVRKDGRGHGTWQPTAFEAELLDRGIELINSRPYHPQTNGKLERFHRTIEDEIWHYKSLSDYVAYYNERRLHFALDIEHYETPLRAFSVKKASEAIRENDPRWMERDINE